MASGTTKHWYDAHYADDKRVLTPWYAGMLEWLRAQRPAGPLLELGCGSGVLLERLELETAVPRCRAVWHRPKHDGRCRSDAYAAQRQRR